MIADLFGGPQEVQVIDRRETPNHGYRAVHVIIRCHELPIEVQVRTTLQDSWAQVVEKMGDLWGRGLRYGIADPNLDLSFGGLAYTRRHVVNLMMSLSDELSEGEIRTKDLIELRRKVDQSFDAVDEMAAAMQLRDVHGVSLTELEFLREGVMTMRDELGQLAEINAVREQQLLHTMVELLGTLEGT